MNVITKQGATARYFSRILILVILALGGQVEWFKIYFDGTFTPGRLNIFPKTSSIITATAQATTSSFSFNDRKAENAATTNFSAIPVNAEGDGKEATSKLKPAFSIININSIQITTLFQVASGSKMIQTRSGVMSTMIFHSLIFEIGTISFQS